MAKGDQKESKAAKKEHKQNLKVVLEDVAFEQSGYLLNFFSFFKN